MVSLRKVEEVLWSFLDEFPGNMWPIPFHPHLYPIKDKQDSSHSGEDVS